MPRCRAVVKIPCMKDALMYPKHPERICWGCGRYCPANDLACRAERVQHPIEPFGCDEECEAAPDREDIATRKPIASGLRCMTSRNSLAVRPKQCHGCKSDEKSERCADTSWRGVPSSCFMRDYFRAERTSERVYGRKPITTQALITCSFTSHDESSREEFGDLSQQPKGDKLPSGGVLWSS